MPRWLDAVKVFAPLVLSFVKPELAPIAGDISQGIDEAEQMKNAKGVDKLAHVQTIAQLAAHSVNTAKGKVVIDPVALNQTVAEGVATTISVLNQIHPKTNSVPVK